MKPPYTLDELMQVLFKRTPVTLFGKKKYPYTFDRYFPPVWNSTENSITFNQQGWDGNFGEIKFGDAVVEIKKPIEGLESKKKYLFSFVWKEEGREDTVIERECYTI